MPPRRGAKRARPEPAPQPKPRVGRYVVVGPQRVLGHAEGDVVELEQAHAARLVRAGHVRPDVQPVEASSDAEPDEHKSDHKTDPSPS